MDDERFDALSRVLGAGVTRRGALGIVAGLAGLGVFFMLYSLGTSFFGLPSLVPQKAKSSTMPIAAPAPSGGDSVASEETTDADYLAAACIAIAREVGDRMMARRPIDTVAACDFAVRLILGGIPALPRLTQP